MDMKEKAAVPTVTLSPAQWDLLVKRVGQKRKAGSGYVRFTPNPVGWSNSGLGNIQRLRGFLDGTCNEAAYCATMEDARVNGLLWIRWEDGREEILGDWALCNKLWKRLQSQDMEVPPITVKASPATPKRYMLERNTDSEETGVRVEIPITEAEIRKMREATLREEIAALHREVRALLGDPS